MSDLVPVLDAPVDVELTLVRAQVDAQLGRRMAALGLRTGAALRVLQTTVGGGRLLSVAGARIAIDKDVAASLQARVTSPELVA